MKSIFSSLMQRLLVTTACGLLLFSGLAYSNNTPTETDELTIGYVGFRGDARYSKSHLRRELPNQPSGRPVAGAETAVGDSKFALMAVGASLKLKDKVVRKDKDIIPTVSKFVESGIQFILLDLPSQQLQQVRQAFKDKEVLLINVSTLDNEFRLGNCDSNLIHTVPSYRQLSDALAQYLITQKWRDVLVLQGVDELDKPWVESFVGSAKRYGLKLTERRDFVVSTDPRQRSKNNIALLTKGKYDVVAVLESLGEFAVQVPYQTQKPRPVVGSAGLVPSWWHWSWERHGAPQLNGRFQDDHARHMTGFDWSAWVAVKAIVQSIQRTESTDFEVLKPYLLDPNLEVDGFKGTRSNFRNWSGQLRQNIFLADGQWVLARAPLEGFLHPSENLDTLGITKEEAKCQ